LFRKEEEWINFLVLKSEGRRLLERNRNQREKNFKGNLKYVVCENVDWIHYPRIGTNWDI
jgi:hypothetical protein